MKVFRDILGQKTVVFGLTTQHVTQPWLAKLWKASGCDFVYIEYEHGFFNEEQLANFVLCCRAQGLPVIAKVPECTRTHVGKLLECGVIGIQLPWTESREQIDKLVSFVKFPPLGIRAAAPGYGNVDYDLNVDGTRFVEQANQQTIILAHIETLAGVGNVSSILENPHVDVAFLGTYDLSVSCGHPGDLEHPAVAEAVEQVISVATAQGKTIGMYVPNADCAKRWISRGVTLFETASEVDLIAEGSRGLIQALRASQSPEESILSAQIAPRCENV